ncbi:MAG: hypothetical protein RBR08_13710 [Desulforegulaceae bacterium]|jgi:flagellar basal body-associated protein FliL|nr:hypothetical protein [Desulforegulaceae bacterium]
MYFIFGILVVLGIVYFVFFSKKKKAEEFEDQEEQIDASYECNVCDDNNCYCEKIDDENED